MKTIALLSGGKDSVLAVMMAMRHGHEPMVIANLAPGVRGGNDVAEAGSAPGSVNEVDSYMFQTVGHEVVEHIAACMGLPLRRSVVYRGQAKDQSLTYAAAPPEDDEVEELYRLLKSVKEEFPDVTAVTTGAILSNYQRNRVERVCRRLGLVSLAYLWQRPASEVLDIATALRVQAVLVKTASVGLDPKKLLGKTLEQVRPTLEKMDALYGAHMAGEGGEFETIVLDCPLFKEERLVVKKMDIVMVDENDYSPSGHSILEVERAAKSAEDKEADAHILNAIVTNSSELVFPSDHMSHLEAMWEAARSLRQEDPVCNPSVGEQTAAKDLFAVAKDFLADCNGIECRCFSSESSGTDVSTTEVAEMFAQIHIWLSSSALVPLSVFARCESRLSDALHVAFKDFAPLVSPPTLTVSYQEGPCEIGLIAATPSEEVRCQLLHAESLSCWAAGFPGSTHSQCWRADRSTASVLMAPGIRGVVPTDGTIADRSHVQDDAIAQLTDRTADVVAQSAYAYANAMSYLQFLRPSASGNAATSAAVVLVEMSNQSDVETLQMLWHAFRSNEPDNGQQMLFHWTLTAGFPSDELVRFSILERTLPDNSDDSTSSDNSTA